MKVSALFCFCVFLLAGATAGHAQSATDFLDKNNKINKPTPTQIDETIAVYDSCEATDMVRRYYDCDCLSATFLTLRAQNPDAKKDDLIVIGRKKCANTPDVAGEAYQNCLNWATRVRSDYESYCSCYANTFAKNFSKQPSDSIRGRELQMIQAMSSCRTGTEITEKRSRWNLIELLKRQGVYDLLFPSAKTNRLPEQNPPQP